MKPSDPGAEYGESRIYGALQPQYEPLPARVDEEQGTLTKWELSLDERRAILDGAKVGLRVLTFGQPLQPVYLFVEGTDGDPYGRVAFDEEART